MLNKQQNIIFITTSILFTLTIVLTIASILFSKQQSVASEGISNRGIKFEISLQQKNIQQIVNVIEYNNTPTKIKKSMTKDVLNTKSKPIKKLPINIKKVQKQKVKSKYVYDKGKIGRLNLQYAKMISDIIQRNMFLNNIYIEKNHTTIINFKINNAGKILFVKITKPSNNYNIDKLVVQTVNSIRKFPAPPKELHTQNLNYIIPVQYVIQ